MNKNLGMASFDLIAVLFFLLATNHHFQQHHFWWGLFNLVVAWIYLCLALDYFKDYLKD